MSSLQRRVFGAREAAAEQVGIEARAAHERDHVAVVRIERDDGAAPLAELFLGDALHVEIHGEDQVLARQSGACVRRSRTSAPCVAPSGPAH